MVRSWTWTDSAWHAGPTFQSTLGGIHAAAWNADATLVFTFGATGGFELFDALTGRRLIVDTKGANTNDPPSGLTVTEADGFSYAHLRTDPSTDSTVAVEVPVRVDRLREVLCVVHHDSACDS